MRKISNEMEANMANYVILLKIVKITYDIYKKVKSSSDNKVSNEEIEDLVIELKRSVDQARIAIISEIRDIRLADLVGDVNEIFVRFSEYTIYDKKTHYEQWNSEGERLREIIDDSAGVIEDLCAELNRLNLVENKPLLYRISNIEHASDIYCLLSLLVPLRAMAMAERSRNYGTADIYHIPSVWLNLKTQTTVMYTAIEYIVKNGFSKILIKRGEPVSQGKYIMFIGYKFIYKFIILFEVHQDFVSMKIQRAQAILDSRKENYLCRQIILSVKTEMESHSPLQIVLSDRDSFDFSTKIVGKLSGGDLYYGGGKFWGNNKDQKKVTDLGAIGDIDLASVNIPDTGYTRFGVSAVKGHTYVSKAQEGETEGYIVFRVIDMKADKSELTIEYLTPRQPRERLQPAWSGVRSRKPFSITSRR